LRQAIGRWAARAAAIFCLGFALFQVALALGAPWGEIAWGGSSPVLPPAMRAASAAAAAYLLGAAVLMLARAGDIGRRWPPRVMFGFNIFLALQLALNTAANLASKSAGEQFGMGAASAAGVVLCLAALLAPVKR
jgi:hypothetical protein